ncbi:hypothetical protein KJ865_01715, partial [Myxococcota bacterium]|nr:hypothetical protein [Myxococcota bacterium]
GIVGGITPSGIFVFRAKEPLTPLLKILAGGTPPLRGALALRFPPGWTTLTGVMEFPSIGMAEAFIAKLRARLASALAASPMKNYPWLAVLHPLSIHPEGRNVYIQWAARLEIFNTLLTATRPLLSRLRAELAGLTP